MPDVGSSNKDLWLQLNRHAAAGPDLRTIVLDQKRKSQISSHITASMNCNFPLLKPSQHFQSCQFPQLSLLPGGTNGPLGRDTLCQSPHCKNQTPHLLKTRRNREEEPVVCLPGGHRCLAKPARGGQLYGSSKKRRPLEFLDPRSDVLTHYRTYLISLCNHFQYCC